MNESELMFEVRKKLKDMPRIKTIRISDKFTSGLSDLILCVQGKFVAVELKTATGKSTALQRLFLEKIRQAGGVAGICHSWDDVVILLKEAGYDI